MIGRRRFLKMMGVSTAAAPLAAKAAAEEQAKAMAGIGQGVVAGEMHIPQPPSYGNSHSDYVRASEYVKMFGLPKHAEEEMRQRARYIGFLDPDLAAKRSWSLAAKVQEQRERNYKRLIEGYMDIGWHERAAKTFQELVGFRWPW